VAELDPAVFPYEGMPRRERRKPVEGAPFYFSGI